MTVFMFPGQGSQSIGMGKDLFGKFPELITMTNDILGYSIENLCLEDSLQQLSKTQFTQPALYVVSALCYLEQKDKGSKPDYCIGHSLGEYVALYAAGAFDFETGLKLVQKRGDIMAKQQGGGMLAVIGLPLSRINSLLSENDITSIDCANFNSPMQLVLSGPSEDIRLANNILSKEAMMCVPLNISAAFHSRYMQDASKEFEQFLNQFEFKPCHTPVISNIYAQPYTEEKIKENLVNQIKSPVLWSETIEYLKKNGETDFIEVGPGNVLTRLMAQN